MDWAQLIPIIMALIAAIGIPVALSRRKKGGQGKLEELHQHLQDIGIKAIPVDEKQAPGQAKKKRSLGERSEGSMTIQRMNIDSISVISVSSQYGVNYYLDYEVHSGSMPRKEASKKTKMTRKKSPPLWGKTVAVEWHGDSYLAQRLNLDYQLKHRLEQAAPEELKGGISIHPEPKHGYTRIRTDYQLLTRDLFEAIDTIAKHVKSGS